MQAKLSQSNIRQLQPGSKPYEVVDTEIKGFLLRVQPTGRKTYYFSYRTQAGQRKRIKIGVHGSSKTAAQARDDAAVYAGKVSQGIDIQGDKVADRKEAQAQAKNTLERFIDEQYQPWALANAKSGQQTINSVKRSFSHLLSQPMSAITVKVIEQWRSQKLDEGLKATTINRVVNALRGILTKAVAWQAIKTHPLQALKNLKIDEGKRARYLSDTEESALYDALTARDDELKAARTRGNSHRQKRGYPLLPDLSACSYGDRITPIVILSLNTGLRRGEVFDLQWQDIDFNSQILTVQGEIAKSSKTRHIPLNNTALTTLNQWRKQAPSQIGRVFPADDGGRLDNVNKSWATVLKKAGISQFRWHDMRHDFASKLVMRGVPLNTVRELCGHASLNTTLRYAHLAPDHRAAAVALIG